jgi:hypothetical protein
MLETFNKTIQLSDKIYLKKPEDASIKVSRNSKKSTNFLQQIPKPLMKKYFAYLSNRKN